MSSTPTPTSPLPQDSNARSVTYIQAPIQGPIHTGQGDINIDSLSYQSATAPREEFLELLAALRKEFQAARESGVNGDILDDAETEIQAVAKEVGKNVPQRDRILGRLERAREYLLSGTAIAAGLVTLVSKVGELMQVAQGLFK